MERVWQTQVDCALPPALSERDLIAAIDEEAEPHIVNHLCLCPHCAARAKTLARFQQQLRAKLYRIFCPSSDDLIDYYQGLLAPERHASITRHLAICPHCSHESMLLDQAVCWYAVARP